MCQNCNNNSCGGCNQQCYQFPPPPGPPGQVGPSGLQGPPGPLPCVAPITPTQVLTGTGSAGNCLQVCIDGITIVKDQNGCLAAVPASTFKIINFATNSNLPQTPYPVDGSEDVILVDSTIAQVGGTADIYLLAANDPAAANRVLRIKDAFNQASIHDIRLIPNGTDLIEGVNAPKSLLLTVGSGGSFTVVTNTTNGYNIV